MSVFSFYIRFLGQSGVLCSALKFLPFSRLNELHFFHGGLHRTRHFSMFTESPPYSRWPPFASRFPACNSMPTFLSPCAYLDFCFSPTVNKDYFSWLSYGNWKKKCLKSSCKVTKSDQGSSVCRAWVWIRKFYPLMCHLLDALLGYLIPLLLWERSTNIP